MNRKSIYFNLAIALACTSFLYACSPKTSTTTSTSTETTTKTSEVKASIIGDKTVKGVISELVTYENGESYTDWKSESPNYIELSGTTANVNSSGAEVKDEKVTITSAGTYVISGKLSNGQIIVDVQDKGTVRLVLNGAEIDSNDNAPIYVKNAGKTIISLEEGTENSVTDGTKYTLEDSSSDEPSAAIFSKDNLVINGTGKLTVKANYKDGITSRDDLKITGGNIEITSVDDGIVGRDILAVKEGTITVTSGGDSMKSSNDSDSTKGIVAVENGTFTLKAEKDGIQADTAVLISDGSFNITAGGGSVNGAKKADEGMGGKNNNNSQAASTTETESKKAIRATADIGIAGGTFNIDSADDSLHSNNYAVIEAGNFTLASGDDGMHADGTLGIKGGNINITKSYEGLEGSTITVTDGEVHITSSDDGVNAGGGVDGSSGQDNFNSATNNMLNINGGYIVVNAEGDGVDSNGSIKMTGGTVLVSGPTASMNGALDYNGTFENTGGLLIAAGVAGMAQAPSDSSSQYSIEMTYPQTQAAGTIVNLQDSNGKTIVTFAPAKEYQTVVISSPEIKKDGSYTLYSGGSSTGTLNNGLYTGGSYANGTKVVSFTASSSVTWLNESGVTTAQSGMGGGHGMKGGQRGQKPANSQSQSTTGTNNQ